MKCEMCKDAAEVKIFWLASKPQEARVCECCASAIWNKLSEFSGTEAYSTFTIEPIYEVA